MRIYRLEDELIVESDRPFLLVTPFYIRNRGYFQLELYNINGGLLKYPERLPPLSIVVPNSYNRFRFQFENQYLKCFFGRHTLTNK
jgi:hypothetical protein